MSTAGKSRCSTTNWSCCTEEAHLIPKGETACFLRNGMRDYGRGVVVDINSDVNLLPLRPDMHVYFDKRWLVIVPKVARVEDGAGARTTLPSPQYVTHILSGEAAEL